MDAKIGVFYLFPVGMIAFKNAWIKAPMSIQYIMMRTGLSALIED